MQYNVLCQLASSFRRDADRDADALLSCSYNDDGAVDSVAPPSGGGVTSLASRLEVDGSALSGPSDLVPTPGTHHPTTLLL